MVRSSSPYTLGVGASGNIFGGILGDLTKGLSKFVRKPFRESMKYMGESIKAELGDKAKNKKRKKAIQGVMGAFLNAIGVFLQLADAMGILSPIMEIISAMFQVVGGAAMESLAPALEQIGEMFKDPEFIESLREIGTAFGELLAVGIVGLIKALPILLNALIPLLVLLGNEGFVQILLIIIKVVGILIAFALLPLIQTIYTIGLVIATFMDLFTLGTQNFLGQWHEFMSPVIGGMLDAVGRIWTLQSGGYVAPRTGGTPVVLAEGGEGEFVIPESKMGSVGMNQEVLWATEDNGSRLDRIAYLLESKGRLV